MSDEATHPPDNVTPITEAKKKKAAKTDTAPEEPKGPPPPSQSDLLIQLATSKAELFHDETDDGHASIIVNGHRETMRLRSSAFATWLGREYFVTFGKAPGSQARTDAMGVLEGKARYDGKKIPVAVRCAEHGGRIYVDLCDEQWRAIEVDAYGWRVVANPPVRFRRARGMLPLPTPEHGGDIKTLRQFVNVSAETDDDFRLLVSWLVAAMRPRGPYAILIFRGEQGSSKSTVARVLRALLDPNKAAIRSVPKDERDLAIAASNGWILAYDNLSGVSSTFSDSLCRVATGGGFATRSLFTDGEEALFDFVRPITLNGIDDIATRPDLAERAIVLALPSIDKSKRKREATFWRDFNKHAPKILGALLTGVSRALANVDGVEFTELPRMADFITWATAAEGAFGWPERSVYDAYAANSKASVAVALGADGIAAALLAMTATDPRSNFVWEGSATELLTLLEGKATEVQKRDKAWPKAPNALTNRLRRAATFLRSEGIEVDLGDRTSKARRIVVTRAPCEGAKSSSRPSPSSPEPNSAGGIGDDHDDDPKDQDRHQLPLDLATAPAAGRDDHRAGRNERPSPRPSHLNGHVFPCSDDHDDGDDDSPIFRVNVARLLAENPAMSRADAELIARDATARDMAPAAVT